MLMLMTSEFRSNGIAEGESSLIEVLSLAEIDSKFFSLKSKERKKRNEATSFSRLPRFHFLPKPNILNPPKFSIDQI